MFFALSKILIFIIQPLLWIFFLLLLGIFWQKKRKQLLLWSFVTYWFFGNIFIADEVARIWEYKAKKISDIDQKYKIGLVLGGLSAYDSNTEMINFNDHADRLIFTEQLYRMGIIQKILVSGGSGQLTNDGYKEAEIMKLHLVANGIDEQDILVECKSRNTKENIFFSAAMLHDNFQGEDILLITSANQMKRALLCCKKANIEVDVFPTDNTNSKRNMDLDTLLLPNPKAFERWESLIHEWIGFLVYTFSF